MSWTGTYDGVSGTRRSVFADNDNNYVFLGTSSNVYRLDVNRETGGLSWQSGNSIAIDDALGIDVKGDYVLVADNDAGLTVIDESTMLQSTSITGITSAKEIDVSGSHAFVVTNGAEEFVGILPTVLTAGEPSGHWSIPSCRLPSFLYTRSTPSAPLLIHDTILFPPAPFHDEPGAATDCPCAGKLLPQ